MDWAIVSTDLNVTKEKDRAALLQRIRADAAANGPPALLILDTVAAALGAESSNDDAVVGKLFAVSQSLVREFMRTVIFVAHPGKDETRGIAGSYRFQGNSDFILRTVKTKDGFRLVKDKDRNGAKRPLFDYTLEFVEVKRTASGKQTKRCERIVWKGADHAEEEVCVCDHGFIWYAFMGHRNIGTKALYFGASDKTMRNVSNL